MGRSDADPRVRPHARLRRGLDRTGAAAAAPGTPSIDASNAADLPALALDLVEPGRRVVYIGLAGTPSLDRHPHAGAQGRHRRRHPGGVGRAWPAPSSPTPPARSTPVRWSPRPSGSIEVGDVLAGWRPPGAGDGPKIHIDPRL